MIRLYQPINQPPCQYSKNRHQDINCHAHCCTDRMKYAPCLKWQSLYSAKVFMYTRCLTYCQYWLQSSFMSFLPDKGHNILLDPNNIFRMNTQNKCHSLCCCQINSDQMKRCIIGSCYMWFGCQVKLIHSLRLLTNASNWSPWPPHKQDVSF